MSKRYVSSSMLIALAVLVFGFSRPAVYKVAPVVNGASILGAVNFKGDLPSPRKILIAKDNDICGSGSREIQWVLNAEGGKGLMNVAVYLEKIDKGKEWQKPKDGYLLNQEGCRFIPEFFAVPNGESLRIVNSDPTLHNIHTYEMIGRARRTMFNVGQPEKGFEFTKPIRTRRGNTVKVECDAHNFMHAWIFVPQNPYYALVDKKGEYRIGDIPAGTYTVKAWHPTLGVKESEVTLAAGQQMTLNFEFSSR
ncbi:MAG: carboxypeptidase regulatory-like domain-containing protein [bacterium]